MLVSMTEAEGGCYDSVLPPSKHILLPVTDSGFAWGGGVGLPWNHWPRLGKDPWDGGHVAKVVRPYALGSVLTHQVGDQTLHALVFLHKAPREALVRLAESCLDNLDISSDEAIGLVVYRRWYAQMGWFEHKSGFDIMNIFARSSRRFDVYNYEG